MNNLYSKDFLIKKPPLKLTREVCTHERIRTLNPRSRNPIFYPVELREQITFNYANNFLTILAIAFPSAVPPS